MTVTRPGTQHRAVDVSEDDEYIPAGPGLPGFVHSISGLGWIFVGLAVLVALARLDSYGLLAPDHEWVIDDGLGLVALGGTVLLVLAPVFLLHRRPAAWSEDRMLAVAAIAVASRPVLDLVTHLARSQLFSWLATADSIEAGWDFFEPASLLLALPGWLLAIAIPFLIVWGFDRLDDRPPSRFPRSVVAIAAGLLILALTVGTATSLLVSAAAGAQISIGWWAIAGLVLSLALAAAWTWAALAALASVRARRGRWWVLLFVGVVLVSLVPGVLVSLGFAFGALAAESGSWSDVAGVLWRLDGLLSAAGSLALAGAFASVPRTSIAGERPDERD